MLTTLGAILVLGMASTTGGSVARRQVFYRYRDHTGRIVIVSSESQVPHELRAKAERVELDGTPLNPVTSPATPATSEPQPSHAPALLLGVGALLVVLTLLFSFRGGGSRTLAKLLGGAALAALLAGLYLGWLRRSTGQSDSLFSTPTELVDDARRAVKQVDERREKQQKVLDEIEREAK